MGYRKVTYLEQIWYMIKYGLKHGFDAKEKKMRFGKFFTDNIRKITKPHFFSFTKIKNFCIIFM